MPKGGQEQNSDFDDLIIRIQKIEAKLFALDFVTKTVTDTCK